METYSLYALDRASTLLERSFVRAVSCPSSYKKIKCGDG